MRADKGSLLGIWVTRPTGEPRESDKGGRGRGGKIARGHVTRCFRAILICAARADLAAPRETESEHSRMSERNKRAYNSARSSSFSLPFDELELSRDVRRRRETEINIEENPSALADLADFRISISKRLPRSPRASAVSSISVNARRRSVILFLKKRFQKRLARSNASDERARECGI